MYIFGQSGGSNCFYTRIPEINQSYLCIYVCIYLSIHPKYLCSPWGEQCNVSQLLGGEVKLRMCCVVTEYPLP